MNDLATAKRRLDAAYAAVENLPRYASVAAVDEAERNFDSALVEYENAKREDRHYATPRGGLKSEPIYRADRQKETSFIRDVFNSKSDARAMDRLLANDREVMESGVVIVGKQLVPASEIRDVTTGGGAAGFLPPAWMAELAYRYPRWGRPFADAVNNSVQLPDYGLLLSIPKVTGGVTVDMQTPEGNVVSETDIASQSLTVPVVTIAGQNDLTIQALERTLPTMDQIVFQDLLGSYDERLDSQMLAGTGSNGQHLGIRGVQNVETVTWTASTPTQVALLPQIYKGAALIASDYKRGIADLLVIHPRRSAWLAAGTTTSFPLFQLGQLFHAVGQQAQGFTAPGPLGFVEVRDGNVGVNYGASTNCDEIYLVVSRELFLMEGALRMRVHEQTLGGNLITRLQVFAFSAFASNREPHAICVISGTGLASPSF